MMMLIVTILFVMHNNHHISGTYAQPQQQQPPRHRIAIIGGGLSGTFVAKYLTDLEKDCSIQSLTIFDPRPILGEVMVVPSSTTTTTGNNIVSNSNSTTITAAASSASSTVYPPSSSHLVSYKSSARAATATATESSSRKDHKTTSNEEHDDNDDDFYYYEVGTSILSKRYFPLVTGMIQSDRRKQLQITRPVELGGSTSTTTTSTVTSNTMPQNIDESIKIVIHNGMGDVAYQINIDNTTISSSSGSSTSSSMSNAILYSFLWRYNIDFYIVSRLASKVSVRLQQLHDLLVNPFQGVTATATENNPNYYDNAVESAIPYHQSPMSLWGQVGLNGFLYKSMEEVCTRYRVRTDLSFWQHYIVPGQGIFRNEVLNPICVVSYHQNTTQANALAGLFAYLISTDIDSSYTIVGGNTQLVSSAWDQAIDTHTLNCPQDDDDDDTTTTNVDGNNRNGTRPIVSHTTKQISTVVGDSIQGFDLYDTDGGVIGKYDIVILAVPMSIAKIDFLIRSHIDESVLQPMPLGGLIANVEKLDSSTTTTSTKATRNSNHHENQQHEGNEALPRKLPKAVTRPYVKATTTIVRKAILQEEYWFPKSENTTPTRSSTKMKDTMKQRQLWQIYMTAEGMMNEYNITAIYQLSSCMSSAADNANVVAAVDEGCTYKIISSQSLSFGTVQKLFGSDVIIELEYQWENTAAPDYRAGDGGKRRRRRRQQQQQQIYDDDDDDDGMVSTDFLLYDGATGFHGHTKAGALYYPRAMELTVSNVETQAMGAKAVANLIAHRLGWFDIKRPSRFNVGDEL
jgi:hypothetical protein